MSRHQASSDEETDHERATSPYDFEGHNMKILAQLREHVLEGMEVTKSILKTQSEHIKALTEMMGDHGRAIQALLRVMNLNAPTPKLESRTIVLDRGSRDDDRRGFEAKRNRALRKLKFDADNRSSEQGDDTKDGAPPSPMAYHLHTSVYNATEIPRCLALVFRPLEGMLLVGIELVVASYIFGRGLNKGEILVEDEHADGSRGAWWSLRPGRELFDDVINMVATMLTHQSDTLRWFLPKTFAQVALSPANHNKETLEYLRTKYMDFADNLRSPFFIETMLEDERFWIKKEHIKPHPSCNDCGVWVIQWMMQPSYWEEFNMEVNIQTRMRLALDLVMGPHNSLARKVMRDATLEWDRRMIGAECISPQQNVNSTPLGSATASITI
ncbi:hypothetical protein PIB30_039587 [Stylosanthes scabra]|uniref:Ubiquitin-like protease family profile domain-containing protein n=1 Tax=Stylosanthes scabra TaxID=79078 RepID=A0ABU6XC30_9FABA|nr:hypothetical protein [Stylosanthes scabra]